MKLQVRTALVLAVVALLAALTGVGSTLATQRLISGKQIRNNSITTKDLRNDGVKAADLGTASVGQSEIAPNAVDAEGIAPDAVGSEEIAGGAVHAGDIAGNAVGGAALAPDAVGSEEIAAGAVHTSDIGNGQVTPEDVDLPEPEQIVTPPSPPDGVGPEFALVDQVGTYVKEDAASQLQVAWTGTAGTGFSPCLFQLRIDGVPAATGAGVVYVANGSTISLSDSALFEGLAVGPHQVQVYARSVLTGSSSYPCTVGPEQAGVDQTFVVTEEVG